MLHALALAASFWYYVISKLYSYLYFRPYSLFLLYCKQVTSTILDPMAYFVLCSVTFKPYVGLRCCWALAALACLLAHF